MNIEIANRLVNLRKSNNLSQEALAEKLGISRQAVSKWERAEASPDTDNLILLARLYKVSLDELLRTEDEIPRPYEEAAKSRKEEIVPIESAYVESVPIESTYIESMHMESTHMEGTHMESAQQETGEGEKDAEGQDKYVDVGFQGVHVKDKNGEVHVGWDGIYVEDREKGENVHIDENGTYVNGKKYEWRAFGRESFPMTMVITIAYLVIGSVFGAWHPGWLLFLLIPIWNSLLVAIEKRDARCFAYPVLATLIFLCIGLFWYAWHPGWVVFLTVPLYYSMVPYFRSLIRRGADREEGGERYEKE